MATAIQLRMASIGPCPSLTRRTARPCTWTSIGGAVHFHLALLDLVSLPDDLSENAHHLPQGDF
jgi:hypothetical protein